VCLPRSIHDLGKDTATCIRTHLRTDHFLSLPYSSLCLNMFFNQNLAGGGGERRRPIAIAEQQKAAEQQPQLAHARARGRAVGDYYGIVLPCDASTQRSSAWRVMPSCKRRYLRRR
jgi:hypothetical protein